ncbi:MAG TPA: phage major capsid protein [Sedimentisphaerales bacterium]|nr:phage major capsid protein [Sedimentisphaerales bacterium]
MTLSAWTTDAYFTTAEQARRWIDITHTNSIMRQILPGFPMSTGTYDVPKFSAGVTPGWQAEGGTKADSKPTPTKVSYTAKLCYILSVLGGQNWQDSSPSAQAALIEHMAKKLASEIDSKILEGDGTGNALTGFYNILNVNTEAYATDLPTSISQAMNEIETDGGSPNFIIMAPVVYGLLRVSTKNSNFVYDVQTGGPLSAWGVPIYRHRGMSTNLGDDSDESWILVGDSEGAMVGNRSPVELMISKEGYVDGVSLYETNQIGFRMEERLALAAEKPEFFCKLTGVPTS